MTPFDSNSLFNINPSRGFLPTIHPLHSLPHISELNQQLNMIANRLPELIKQNKLDVEVNALNTAYSQCDIELTSHTDEELSAATMMLLFIAQGFIWSNREAPKNLLPSVIARNLYSLCRGIQRLPALTYADYALNNWQLQPTIPISLTSVEPIFTFTGTRDEAWFIKIHLMIEAVCGKAIHAALSAVKLSLTSHSSHELIPLLNDIASAVTEGSKFLKQMVNGCDPLFYWTELRHYLNGWEKVKNMQNDGVSFEGVFIRNENPRFSLKGATGAQSSILPALDAALGIQHDIDHLHQMMLTFQQYMPRKDVLLIHFFGQSKIKTMVKSAQSKELTDAWENAVEQVRLFRLGHMHLVKQYIYQPAEYGGIDASNITGTGGTSIEEYLQPRYEKKQSQDR